MKIGIIQGRLLPPINGHIQESPSDWRKEFILLRQLDLNHVEWIVTTTSFEKNPVFYEELKEFKISSICADNLVDEKFTSDSFLRENLDPICIAALKNKIDWVTIPLLEKSDISNETDRKNFTSLIIEYADRYPKLNFSFEAETHWNNVLEIANLKDNFWITYDTGNITSQRLDHSDYIRNTIHKISNVHLKDRTFSGQTIAPATGDTDFKTIFNTLSEMKYNGLYTLQTARGLDGMEIQTIHEHKKLFERMNNFEDDSRPF